MNYDNYDCRIRVAPPKAAKAVRRKTAPKTRRTSRALTRTIGALAVAICSLATVANAQFVFQPQSETTSKDAKVYEHVSGQPLSSDLSVVNAAVGGHFASALQFNISSLTISASEITSAYITLYSTGNTGSTSGSANPTLTLGGSVSLSPILESWRENNGDPASGPLGSYAAFFGVPADPGPAADPTLHWGPAVATTEIGTGAGFYTWDVTNLVKSWVSGSTQNYGVFIQAATPTTDVQFADVDFSGPSFAPSLTVVPEPGSAILALAGAAALFVRRRRAGAH